MPNAQLTRSIFLATVIGWATTTVFALLQQYTGLAIPDFIVDYVNVTVVGVAASLIPDSVKDIIKQLDVRIIREAARSEDAPNVPSDLKNHL